MDIIGWRWRSRWNGSDATGDPTVIEGLALPARMVALVDAGIWPRGREGELRQNLEPLFPPERVGMLVHEETTIHLSPIEYVRTIAKHHDTNASFWSEYGALHEIDPKRALVIGDFGLGSDSALILDYREQPQPCVLYLRWAAIPGGAKTNWVRCADSFDQFADLLGLR